MQKWDYKLVIRRRGTEVAKNKAYVTPSEWDVNMEKILPELGNDGWELIAVVPRSGFAGGVQGLFSPGVAPGNMGNVVDLAGFTSEELWVFKRPRL